MEKDHVFVEPGHIEAFDEFLTRDYHLGRIICERAQKFKGQDKVAVRHKVYGEWEDFSYEAFGKLINTAAKALIELGAREVTPINENCDFTGGGQGKLIGIFTTNRVEWAVVDFASFYCRAASVPIYATNSAAELKFIVDKSELEILFVGDQVQYEKALGIMDTCPSLKHIITVNKDIVPKDDPRLMTWKALLELGEKSDKQPEVDRRLKNAKTDDIASLIYTSGTTGEPKGVMLTHKNWLAMLFDPIDLMVIEPTDVNLAFLPLSHVFERAWSYRIFVDEAQVDYCHDTKQLPTFLKESAPMYMCSVPRLWEKIHGKVMEELKSASPVKQKLFAWSFDVGKQYQTHVKAHQPVPAGLEFKHKLASKLVLDKVRANFGGRTKLYNCGGAAFSSEVAEFFWCAGINLLQGYGMTECFSICISNREKNKFGTCGPVAPLMEVKLGPEIDGNREIRAKSPSTFAGYYKQPDLTREAFDEEGFVMTGDAGAFDENGYVIITDRIKDLFKTSGGKYVAPQQIENLLKTDYYIADVAAIGDKHKYVSALIVPNYEALEMWAQTNNIAHNNIPELINHPAVKAMYKERINEATTTLGQVEKVKQFTLMPREFSQETGELTPTMKVKRKAVNQIYANEIAAMYPDE
ncbi:MAG: long-chain fatty acid--CoA ligase [Bacillota bacterium]|nr:long-chain fatty acid--CoA ligase [Bacillota bacterium]